MHRHTSNVKQCENAVDITGNEVWPTGCCLRLISGSHVLSSVDRVLVPNLGPGSEHDVVLPLTSPAAEGSYSAEWCMTTFTGTPFGGYFNLVTAISHFEVCMDVISVFFSSDFVQFHN